MSATIQETEYLYTQFVDMDGQMPSVWYAHPILKRTKEFVFVAYTIGRHSQTKRLPRRELEAEGEVYWSRGTLVICFYTEQTKKRIDEIYESQIPECLKAFGLKRNATIDELKQAYRRMAIKCHPDTGGSNVAFQQMQEQYNSALKMMGA